MKKRFGSLLLILALCFTLLPTAALATDNSVDTWDGTADTSWYTSAPDASEYHILTAEQLAGLAQLVNADPGTTNFAGKTFYLDNDIDLSGHEWISIGTVLGGDCPEYSFCGVFDGQGHVISNLYSHESYIEGADESHNLFRNALFGNVYDGEVKNLGVVDAEIWIDPNDDSAAGKGILVDWMGKSKITNCWTSAAFTAAPKRKRILAASLVLPCRAAPFPVAIQQQHLQVISLIPEDIIRIQIHCHLIPLAVLLVHNLMAI